MERQAYQEVENRSPNMTTDIDGDEAYEMTEFNVLSQIVLAKLPSAKYVHVEALWEPESNSRVFNLMFYDDDEESIGGLELTPFQIFWDDEE